MNRRYRRTFLAGLACLACSFAVPAWAAEPGAEPYEIAVIAGPDGMLPPTLWAPAGRPVKLWVANGQNEAGTLTVALPAPLVQDMKKNTVSELALGELGAGQIEVAFLGKKDEAPRTAVLQIGDENTAEREGVAILAERKKFLPGLTHLRAARPTTLFIYATVGLPHGDIGLFGTEVKLPFKARQIGAVDLPEGLAAGAYPISRPGQPNQKHGIVSKVVVE